MRRILDILLKDLVQILRDRKTFLFLLIMPVGFTLLFGLAFGGSGKSSDPRLPVGYLDQDQGSLGPDLKGLLAASTVIRLDENGQRSLADLDGLVSAGNLAAAVVVPAGFSRSLLDGDPLKLIFIADPSRTSTAGIQAEILLAVNRLESAVQTARIVAKVSNEPLVLQGALKQALAAWHDPPVQITVTSGVSSKPQNPGVLSMAQSSPAMMLQFAIAGLLTAATILVNERKNRSLQRLLTTATSRFQILMGHYLAMVSLIFIQFMLLIAFGQVLGVNYLRLPLASLLVAFASALCIAALGLLIGVVARSEEQAIVFCLVPMFILSGLGGAWVPLEYTGVTFQAIGHASPVAWAMDGFKNIVARGLGFSSVLIPVAALTGYTLLFLLLAAWRFQRVSE